MQRILRFAYRPILSDVALALTLIAGLLLAGGSQLTSAFLAPHGLGGMGRTGIFRTSSNQAPGTASMRTGSDSSALTAPAADPDLPEIIDAHTHTDFSNAIEEESGIMHSEDEYLREMREAGITGAVSHTTRTGFGYHEDLKIQHNVVFCAGVDAQVDVARVEAGLKSGRYGCIKIYLGYVHQYAYDPGYEPAYKLAQKYGVPVVFHTGDTSTHDALIKYSDPLTIDEVAVNHPKVNFVIAHCGNPWIESAAEVAYKNPNVYLECSALLIGDLAHTPNETIDEYLVKPVKWIWGYVDDPKKLMYGTDWPLTPMKDYLEAYKRAIPREYWKAVFHDNAARIFKLK